MPRPQDMAIFFANDNNDNDNDTIDYFTPCACVRGNKIEYPIFRSDDIHYLPLSRIVSGILLGKSPIGTVIIVPSLMTI